MGIHSERIVKRYGLRAKVGTFDKHNPKTFFIDATINIDGTKDLASMCKARDLIDDALYAWLQEQEHYDRKRYVKIVDVPETSTRAATKSTTNHLHFDLSLLQKQPRSWNETVEVATKHLGELYESISRSVTGNGLSLQDFKGYRAKS